jgi:hypothetical protein
MLDQRWRILGVLFLARTAMGFQFQSVASTTPFLMAELHIDYGGIGSLIGLYMVPGIIVAFPSGLPIAERAWAFSWCSNSSKNRAAGC